MRSSLIRIHIHWGWDGVSFSSVPIAHAMGRVWILSGRTRRIDAGQAIYAFYPQLIWAYFWTFGDVIPWQFSCLDLLLDLAEVLVSDSQGSWLCTITKLRGRIRMSWTKIFTLKGHQPLPLCPNNLPNPTTAVHIPGLTLYPQIRPWPVVLPAVDPEMHWPSFPRTRPQTTP